MLGAFALACCDEVPGLDFNGGLQIGNNVTDVTVTRKRARRVNRQGGSFMERVERAIQEAVHPDSVASGGPGSAYASDSAAGQEAIAFSVVSPYRPLTATRVPVAGLTAFPQDGYYFNGEPDRDFNNNGDDPSAQVPPGHESLGFIDPIGNTPVGIGLNADAFSPLGMKWEGIIGQITQTVPAIISSAKGKAYYDPSGNANPQLVPRIETVATAAPEGFYYDERGTLRQIGSNVGGAVGNIGQSISDFVQANPLLVLGGGAALVLLFMRPPGRR
jgi:hypothetical protein